MKLITAKEYYDLLNSKALKNTEGSYWESKISVNTKRIKVYRAPMSERMYDYGSWESDEETEVVTHFTLKLKELLESKGYAAAIYPIQFSLPTNHRISKEGCRDLFETTEFDEMLFSELKWCFEDYYRLGREEIKKTISRLSKNQLTQLYQDDIDTRCKEMIFAHYPDCDPIIQVKDIIQQLFSKANSLIEQKKKDANWFDELQQYYDEIQKKLQDDIPKEDKIYFNETLDKIYKDRLKMARKAFSDKKYKLALNCYSQLIEKHLDTLNKLVYVRRAFIHYILKDFKKALADLKRYNKLIKDDENKAANYYICRALIMAAQKEYENAAIGIYNIAVTASDNLEKANRRNKFFNLLPKEHIAQILAALLHNAKNDESNKDRKRYKKEYIAYITLAAEASDPVAQFTLSQMLWENDRFQAEMWLGRAAANHHAEAQYKLANFYRERIISDEDAEEYNFVKIKDLLKEAASSNNESSKSILAIFHERISEIYKSDAPIIDNSKKRKIFKAAITDYEQANPFSVEPPFKLPRIEQSPLDVFLDSSDPGKRVRIPDTTIQMAEQVEQAFKKDKSENKRNYVAANLTIIFADHVTKEKRTARLIRTIPITDEMATGNINIQTLFGIKHNGRLEYDEVEVKKRHKNILEKAQSTYQRIPHTVLKEDKDQLEFIPSTVDKKYNPHKHLHSEYALYEYLINGDNFSKLLDKFVQKYKNVFKEGCKVYGVIIDFYSNRASCSDCKKVTFSLQNQGELLKKIQKVFHDKGYVCLTRRKTGLWNEGELHLLVRIRAGQELKDKNDLIADKDIIPSIKNLKTLNNQFFFHKIEKPSTDDGVTPEKFSLFESGTNAKRPQK